MHQTTMKRIAGELGVSITTVSKVLNNQPDISEATRTRVLAKVEVEQRALKAIRCEAELASARVAQAKERLADQELRVASGESTKQEVDVAKAALSQLIVAAETAVAKRERAELESAEANLHRQQKLLKLGSAYKSDVTNAEEKLAELKAPKN